VIEAADATEVTDVTKDQEVHAETEEVVTQDPALDPPTAEEETIATVAEIAVTATTATIVMTEEEETTVDVIHMIASVILLTVDVILPTAVVIGAEALRTTAILRPKTIRVICRRPTLSTTTALSKGIEKEEATELRLIGD
jgi:hypothetical protein